jgi:hypothetical protein
MPQHAPARGRATTLADTLSFVTAKTAVLPIIAGRL